jgi:hypothetical protein
MARGIAPEAGVPGDTGARKAQAVPLLGPLASA